MIRPLGELLAGLSPHARRALESHDLPELPDPSSLRQEIESLTLLHPELLQPLDSLLMRLHEIESAPEGLPSVIGELRRTECTFADSISSTWRAWNVHTASPELVRCLRPALRFSSTWLRRMERGTSLVHGLAGICPCLPCLRSDWPHVRVPIPGLLLHDLLPMEDPVELPSVMRWTATAVQALGALHQRGMLHGHISARFIVLEPARARLIWLDPPDPRGASVPEDIAALARALAALDPSSSGMVGQMLSSWADSPPACCHDAESQLHAAMTEHLLNGRHLLARRRRNRRSVHATLLLLGLLRELASVLPPTHGEHEFLSAEGARMRIWSDGVSVWASHVGQVPDHRLFSPSQGVQVLPSRALMRAWAKRSSPGANPDTEPWAEAQVRWLSAHCRLRAQRMLLEHRVRGTLEPVAEPFSTPD